MFYYIPDNDLLILILVPSSLLHFTLGVGDPDAWQFNLTFAPSLTITSVLLRESSILGGTETKQKKNILKFNINPNTEENKKKL